MWYNRHEACEKLGLTSHQLRYRVNKGYLKWKKNGQTNLYWISEDTEEVEDDTSSDFFTEDQSGYYYDPSDQKYVFFGLPDQPPVVRVSRERIEGLIRDYSNETGGMTVNQVAGKYSLSRASVKHILSRLGKTHDSAPFSDESLKEGDEDQLVANLLKAKEQRVLVKAQMRRINSDLKRLDNVSLAKHLIDQVAERLESLPRLKLAPQKSKVKRTDDFICIFGLTDLHIGKRGVDGFNSEIASKRAISCITQGADSALNTWGHPEYWVVTCGSDMLHVDTYKGTTERGTPMDTDTDPVSMLAIAYSTMEYITQYLRGSAPVKVVAMSGNHDRLLSAALGLMLQARYQSEADVEVIDGSQGSSYIRYGKSLLGFNHGDCIKPEKLPSVMSSERAEDWGECRGNWEWFTGHLHSLILRVQEYSGCRVWTMPALSGTDRWHKQMGYTGNRAELAMFKVEPNSGVTAVELIKPRGKNEDI